jgi:hypothetical protein
MATTYTATLQVQCWKEHQCVGCDSRYRYRLSRKVSGTGPSESAAARNAQKAAVKTIERDVDTQPCPVCGYCQPDMIGVIRARRHWYVFWISLVCLLVPLILGLARVVPLPIVAWLTAGLGAACFLAHQFVAQYNPNRNLDANQQEGVNKLESGQLQLVSKGEQVEEGPVPGASLGGPTRLALLCVLVGVVAVTVPEVLRLTNGWPVNANQSPPVAGPGDKVTFYFPVSRSSVKGYWSGSAQAQVRDANNLGLANTSLQPTSHTSNWGNNIQAKSSEKNSSFTPWVELTIPNKPELAGQTLTFDLSLQLLYPLAMGNQFNNMHDEIKHSATVALASPLSGQTYIKTWWLAALSCLVLTLGGGICLAVQGSRMRQQAHPTQVMPVGEEEPSEQEPEGEAETP